MLRNAGDMKGLTIHASDGEIGMVDHFYFDDQSWVIRYLVVDTGGWLSGLGHTLVLISPYSLGSTDWHARSLNVLLTKQQVAGSPAIDTYKPVSRQHEREHNAYHGYPHYWAGPYLWGSEYTPAGVVTPAPEPVRNAAPWKEDEAEAGHRTDSHLRSTREVHGHAIEAADGEIGHVQDFVIDDQTWAVRYLEVATRNWLPGKKVLLPPSWIKSVSWRDSKVFVDLQREKIKASPEYVESEPISRAYETLLYQHYGQPPYWLREAEQMTSRS
jgi:uncharacterized protein YrrD